MPTTIEQHKASLHQPAFSELLPVRDILNDVIIRTTGGSLIRRPRIAIKRRSHYADGAGICLALKARSHLQLAAARF